MKLKIKLFALLALFFVSLHNLALAESLKDFAAKNVITAETIKQEQTATPNLFKKDQINNFKVGEIAVSLSEKGLDDLDGISSLKVLHEGKTVPITMLNKLHLFINRNNIKTVPEEIGAMTNVKFLYLKHNQLSNLPKVIAQLTSLEGIYCTANQFTEIPDFIFDMTFLRKLEFADNQLTSLSPRLGNLKRLIHLNMSGNKIQSLPGTLGNLRKLRVFDVSANQITTLEKGIETISVDYIFRLRKNPIKDIPLELFKIRANIDITDTNVDPIAYSEEQRVKFSAEKKDPRKGFKIKNEQGQIERVNNLEEAQKRNATLKEAKIKLKEEKMLRKQEKTKLKEEKALLKQGKIKLKEEKALRREESTQDE